MEPKELIQMRRAAKLTQAQTADALGFTLRGYQKLESGESPLKPHHEAALRAILEKDPNMNINTMTVIDPGVIIDANLKLTEALIKKLVNLGIIEKTDVADMLNDIIEGDKEASHPNAAGVESLLRRLFVAA